MDGSTYSLPTCPTGRPASPLRELLMTTLSSVVPPSRQVANVSSQAIQSLQVPQWSSIDGSTFVHNPLLANKYRHAQNRSCLQTHSSSAQQRYLTQQTRRPSDNAALTHSSSMVTPQCDFQYTPRAEIPSSSIDELGWPDPLHPRS